MKGKLGLVLMGGTMFSKSLIQFSVDMLRKFCSLPVIYLGPNSGGGNEDMGTFFKRSHACTAILSAPNLLQATADPRLHQTLGHTQASLAQSLVGSLLLSPGSWCTQGSVCALQESILQSYVCSGSSLVGLMATSSKKAYAIPKFAEPRAPAPVAVHC